MSIEIRGSSSSGEVTVIASRVCHRRRTSFRHWTTTDLNDLLKFKRHKRHNGERHRPLFQLIGLQHTGKFGWWPPSYRASRHTVLSVLSLSASPIGFSDSWYLVIDKWPRDLRFFGFSIAKLVIFKTLSDSVVTACQTANKWWVFNFFSLCLKHRTH